MKYHNKKSKPVNLIGDLFSNSRGSILALVVMVGACLFIVISAMLLSVNVNTNENRVINNSENAYLAAKSGIQLLEDTGSDSTIINQVYKSIDQEPIVMNFGDLGTCEIKVKSAEAETTDASGNKTRMVMAECTGKYEGQTFTLTRKLKLTGTPVGSPATSTDIPMSAYTQFSSSEVKLDGAMDGHTNILSDALVKFENASVNNPIDTVNAMGSIHLGNSGILANSLGVGKSIDWTRSVIKNNVYVGANNDDGSLKDGIFMYAEGSSVGGTIMCEGDLIVTGFDSDLNGYKGGIGVNNYDTVNNKLIAENFDAIRAGHGDTSKVYIGYQATVADDAQSYTLGKWGNTTGMSCNVYGRVLVNGDLYINSTSKIYGDIICTGKVVLDNYWGYQIYGNIYAKEVEVKLNTNADYYGTTTFPNGTEIYALGNITFANSGITNEEFSSKGIKLYPNQSTISKLIEVSGNFVGAADYFEDIKDDNGGGTDRPTTTFPSELSSLPTVQFANPACDDPSVAALYTGNDSNGGTVNALHITKSCRIDQAINLNGQYPINDMYIDTSAYDENIDIYLTGSITRNDAGVIAINDNGGKNRVRIFMEDGSAIKFDGNDSTRPGFLVVSDDAADSNFLSGDGFTSFPYSTMDYKIDQSKVPQLYFFAKEPEDKTQTTNATFDIGQAGYIPGYVLTPYLDIISSANSHCYQSNTKVGYDPSNDSVKKATNVPFIYGMIMCNWGKFQGGTMTSVKFDDNLINDPVVAQAFQDACAGVYYYGTPSGAGGGTSTPSPSPSSTTYEWNIDNVI